MFEMTLIALTFIIPICILWMNTENNLQLKHNIFLSFLFIVPIISQLVSMVLLIMWLLDEFEIKFKPIPNPFKHKPKDTLPKCEFSEFIRWLDGFTKNKGQYISELWFKLNVHISPSLPTLKRYFYDKKDSPYYSGSLLGVLENTFILWCDNVFKVEFRKDSRYIENITLKQEITKEHIEFLEELLEAAKIPYEWICNQELRDRAEKENFEREQSKKFNNEFSEVVKSMRADLEKIYGKNGNGTSEKERVRLL